ncbi:MAG: hypothetical protein ABW208_10130 [Pyrinomonadaceae bacterium]
MPFVIPIQSFDDPVSALLTFAGETSLALDSTATQGGRLVFAGATQLSLRSIQSSAITFAGATALSITGPQGYGSIAFEGSTQLTLAGGVRRTSRLAFEGSTGLTLRGTYTQPEEFGFTVFVDVLSADLSAALESPANIRRLRPRLLVGGVPLACLRAEESAQVDRLGVELSVVLARPDVNSVSFADAVDFEIGVWTGAGYEYVPRLTGARLSGRGARYANEDGLPADAVSLSFVDVLGDRWNRAPERNIVLYDPDELDEPAPQALSELSIYDEAGARIEPEVRAVAELSLLKVLEAAFVEGCGFDSVVTNVEDFPIEQVAFTRAGGYDAAVRGFLSLYDVVPSVVGSDLWLIDTGAELPAGLSPRAFPASQSLALDVTLPRREPVSAILVHLKDESAGEYSTERPETPAPVESGTFGLPGYTVTRTERRIREWRNFAAPTVVVREETLFEDKTVEDHEARVISRETRTDSFDALGRSTGYRRTVEERLPDVEADGELLLQTVAEEEQLIVYTPDPRDTRRDLQDRVETRTAGLILVDADREYLGEPYRLPLADAHRSGYVDPDAGQRTEFGRLKTELIELKVRGQQVTRERRVINHLTNAPDSSGVQVLPADNSVERVSSRVRSVLVRAEDGGGDVTSRRVPEFDGTSLPPELALKLARRQLAQLNNPQREVTVQAAYVDPLVRRGSDLRLYGRASEPLLDAIVRGYFIVFSSEGDDGFDAQMSIQGKELNG